MVCELPIRFRFQLKDKTSEFTSLDILKLADVSKKIYDNASKEGIEEIAKYIINFTYEVKENSDKIEPTEEEIEQSEKQLLRDMAMMIRSGHINAMDYSISFFYVALKEIYQSNNEELKRMSTAVISPHLEDYEKFMRSLDDPDAIIIQDDDNSGLKGLMNKEL